MKTILVTLIMLSACAMNVPDAGSDQQQLCGADKAGSMIGSEVEAETGDKVQSLTGAKSLRMIRPGTMVTMDYRPDRLNVHIGENSRIERISCG